MIELVRPLEMYMLKEVCKFYKKSGAHAWNSTGYGHRKFP